MRALVLVLLAACSFPEKQFVSGDAQQGDGRRNADAAADALPGFECRNVPLPTTAPATINIHGTMYDITGMMPLAGATVSVVVGVSNTTLGSATTAGDGSYSISVSTGGQPVDAYVIASAPNYMNTAAYPAVPYSADAAILFGLVTPAGAQNLGNVAGAPYDTTDGLLQVGITDCVGQPLSGAVMQNPQPTKATERYVVGNTLPASATMTDSSGTVYLINVTPSAVTLDASLMDGMPQYPRTVQVHPGEFDYVAVQPTPGH
jgi:hypothetical protein